MRQKYNQYHEIKIILKINIYVTDETEYSNTRDGTMVTEHNNT